MALVLAATVMIAWLIMWRTAHRLRPPLLRLGLGPRIANYLLISWRELASMTAAIALLACVELWSRRSDLGAALDGIGLKPGAPAGQLGVLSVLLFATCYAINLGFGFLRRSIRVRPTAATVNMVPATVAETIVFSLVLSPVSGVSEEVVFRGLLQWAFIVTTGDPISAVASQAVLFGIIHLYQGGIGVLRTFVVGLVLGAGTLASGSLIPAIIAHTLINAAVGTGRVSRPIPASSR
jgi:membrane protease YdiL (CAAX protease family)